jgi:Family of unknown function (DUF5995)
MSIKRLVCLVAAIVSLGAGSAHAQSNWPGTGTEQMAADQTVPYLPAVPPLICPGGEQACLAALATELSARTQALQDATGTPGFFDRPDRVNHEAKTYAQEYFDQFDRWHAGAPFAVASPAWEVAFRAARLQSVTALGDLMLALNAHIRRDNPIRAVEQTEGVLRVPGTMPAASGKPDHERVNVVLVNAMTTMLTRLARRYDPTLDDGADLDPRALYSIIAAWREESWRNAEQLRHARATGGVNGMLYQAKLAQIELTAKLGADAILAATLTDPLRNAQRNAYCEAHS